MANNKWTTGFFKLFGLEESPDESREAPSVAPQERYSPPSSTTTTTRGVASRSEERRPPVRRRMDEPLPEPSTRVRRSGDESRMVSMPPSAPPSTEWNGTYGESMVAGMKMVIYQPQSYDDTQRIIDELKAARTVIINLEDLNVEVAQRVLDFISGAVYALNGNVRKVSRGIFLMAPQNVDISGNFINNLPAGFRNQGYFSGRKTE